MKLLRNPIVTGALVVIALVFILYQVVHTGRGRGRTYLAQPVAPAASTPTAPRAPDRPVGLPRAVPSKAAPSAPTGIDRDYIALHFAGWMEGTRRDPFLLHQSLNQQKAATNAPSPLSKWKLKAIWNQTGSRVAAINNALYREGDVIDGYKIIRIENEVVWLQNPDSLDHLEFHGRAVAGPPPLGATNALNAK